MFFLTDKQIAYEVGAGTLIAGLCVKINCLPMFNRAKKILKKWKLLIFHGKIKNYNVCLKFKTAVVISKPSIILVVDDGLINLQIQFNINIQNRHSRPLAPSAVVKRYAIPVSINGWQFLSPCKPIYCKASGKIPSLTTINQFTLPWSPVRLGWWNSLIWPF